MLFTSSIFLTLSIIIYNNQALQLKDDPLILTPLLKSGAVAEAREASRVHHKDLDNITSYTGFFTVNETFNSNLFFWFFPHPEGENVPLLLWLQGGPGASSLFGLFVVNGPFQIKENVVGIRNYTWCKEYSMLYVDNPVGTGYSFTNDNGFSENETVIGENLYNALVQFFELFPNMRNAEFYATGESYAGKYVPAVAYTIHKRNQISEKKINLVGIVIGDGAIDPINQIEYGDFLYYAGLIDQNGRELFKTYEDKLRNHIKQQQWLEAYESFDLLIGGASQTPTIFRNLTGFRTYYNFLDANESSADVMYFFDYLERTDVRNAIHVGNSSFDFQNMEVMHHLQEDMYQSVAPWFSVLVDEYRVLLYSGQTDVIVNYIQTETFLRNLKFGASEEYKTAQRELWYVDAELAGYYKKAGKLVEVLVRNAGHMVPKDQPKWALEMMTTFTRGDFK